VKKKTLRVKTERLGELTNEELVRVAGGSLGTLTGTETYRCPTVPVTNCVSVA
jgi:hypothetical protein